MANTRNSQKKEKNDAPTGATSLPAGAPVVADMKDSGNTDIPVTTLDAILQSLRSIEAKFDERIDEIESTSEHHEEAFLSLSTRLNRIENQLAEQNMQHDNNQNLNDNNQNVSGNDVNNSYQNVNNNNQNVNINNQNDLFNHGLLNNGGGLPARIRLQQNMPQMEDLSVSHAQGQPHQPHQPPQLSQPIPRSTSDVVPVLHMRNIKSIVEDELRGIRLDSPENCFTALTAECIGLDLTGSVTYIRTNYVKVQGGTAYEIPGDDIPPDKAKALKLKIPPDKANALKLTPDNYRQIQREKKWKNWQRKRH